MQSLPTVTVDQVPDPLPDGLCVLDVREPDEWQDGHIEGALHIPLMTLPVRTDELPADTPLLVVCHVGGRSAQATAYLVQQGYDAVNLAGGMADWAAAGRAITR